MNAHSKSGAKPVAKRPFVLGRDEPSDGAGSLLAAIPAASATDADGGAVETAGFIEPELRRSMIAEAAYYRAERRGFEPGRDLEDWLLAEGEIDGMLTRGDIPAVCGIVDLA